MHELDTISTLPDGCTITWMGVLPHDHETGRVAVSVVGYGGSPNRSLHYANLGYDTSTFPRLRDGDPNSIKTTDGITVHGGKAGARRLASTLGWNIACDGRPGTMKVPMSIGGCVCAYDIETDISSLRGSSFPLPDEKIISASMYCSCGYAKSFNTMGATCFGSIPVRDTTDVVRHMIYAIIEHKPQWLIGWNNFCYDNVCLAQWVPREFEMYFEDTTAGPGRRGYIIDIPMVYNVDLYVYMDRARRGKYKQLSLSYVASVEGAPLKTKMPVGSNPAFAPDMIEYNMNDCLVTCRLWSITGVDKEIPNLSAVACAPVQDACRYTTGRLAECAISSFCISRSVMYCWAEKETIGKFKGGYVMDPEKGLHDNVVVCDFNSMYPTIFSCANISPESLYIMDGTGGCDGSISWRDKSVSFTCGDKTAVFALGVDAVLPAVAWGLVKERSLWKKERPDYAYGLKVTANSIYGVTGYEMSPMYSPMCSQSVTSAGRWCMTLASMVFSRCGMEMVYGDTDSVMCKSTSVTSKRHSGDVRRHANECLSILHRILSFTAFPLMHMELENVHSRMLILEKKKYSTLSDTGSVVHKGISAVRKDVIGVCRRVSDEVVSAILEGKSHATTARHVSKIICSYIDACILRRLSISDVSVVVREGGRNVCRYTDVSMTVVDAPMDGLDANSIVMYDIGTVSKAIVGEAGRYTRASGQGSPADVMRHIDVCSSLGF